jgi:serine/threonine protein kinase
MEAREYMEHVISSGLMDREELDRALQNLWPTDRAKKVARHLVDLGKLTKFQAERLLIGRTDGSQLGQYRILDDLGRGGMGRVYKAVHQSMGRFVALKVLAPDLTKTERAKELFQREVRAAARLTHPNIVTSYDAQIGERCFLVMEYVDGPNLSQLVREQGPLPIEQACEYIRQAAIGLDYAHGLGLIHRDVKPSNLLVQQSASGPQVKILDFGLALVTAGDAAQGEPSIATVQTVLGTPDYVSPEQARNQYGVDGRSDLYSLGCTFYFLLTGEAPFGGGTALEKIVKHGTEAPVAVQTKRPDVPEAVAAIVHKLLAKNPKWRYQKAGDLALELATVVGNKADWIAPPRPKPKLGSKLELGHTSSGDDPFEEVELDGPSGSSTLPTAAMGTRETMHALASRGRGSRKKRLWPWIILAVGLAFAVVTGVGLMVRFIINQLG